MLAGISNPCLVDGRFARPKIAKGRSSLVQFVSGSPEPRLLKDFVGIAVGFCPLSQEREH